MKLSHTRHETRDTRETPSKQASNEAKNHDAFDDGSVNVCFIRSVARSHSLIAHALLLTLAHPHSLREPEPAGNHVVGSHQHTRCRLE